MGRRIMKTKRTLSLRTMMETLLSAGIRMGAFQGLIFLRSSTPQTASGCGRIVTMGRSTGQTGLNLWRWMVQGEFMFLENAGAAALLQSSMRLMARRYGPIVTPAPAVSFSLVALR